MSTQPSLRVEELPLGMLPLWRVSVEQYHDMVEKGVIGEDDPVELLEGVLVTKMPSHPQHSTATELTRDALTPLVPNGYCFRTRSAITLAESAPEPDLAVVRGTRRDFAKRHPAARDVALLVEVSDSSLDRDRNLKRRVYAQAGIPVYWIVNLQDRCVEVYSAPSGDEYTACTIRGDDATIDVTLDGVHRGTIPVREPIP